MSGKKYPNQNWSYGAVPLARDEIHNKVIEIIGKEPKGKVLDIPTGTGALAMRLSKMGFEVYCCDINTSYFSVPNLKVEMGDLNQSLPYPDGVFDYITCLDGIEHTENPYNAIREFQRILRKGGKIFISTPNFLNIERRIRFLFTGNFSKIPSHPVIKNIWRGDLSMAHLSPLGYPLLKFIMEYYGFRILQLEKDRTKPKMIWLLPLVWGIRFFGRLASQKRRELYCLDETTRDEVILGGNTLIIIGEKVG